jgi:hypothetical protein
MANYMAKFKDGSSSIVSDADLDDPIVAEDDVDLVKQEEKANENVSTANTPVPNQEFQVVSGNTQQRVPQRTGQLISQLPLPQLQPSAIDGTTIAPKNTNNSNIVSERGVLSDIGHGFVSGIMDHPASLLATALVASNPVTSGAALMEAGLTRLAPVLSPVIRAGLANAVEATGLNIGDQLGSHYLKKSVGMNPEGDVAHVDVVPALQSGLLGGLGGMAAKTTGKFLNWAKNKATAIDEAKATVESAKKYKETITDYTKNAQELGNKIPAGTPNKTAQKIKGFAKIEEELGKKKLLENEAKIATTIPTMLSDKARNSIANGMIGSIAGGMLTGGPAGVILGGSAGAYMEPGIEAGTKIIGNMVNKYPKILTPNAYPAITRGLAATRVLAPQAATYPLILSNKQDPLAPVDSSFIRF